MRQKEGHNHNKIKSQNHWVGDLKTGEQLFHRIPPTGVKVLSPTSGFPTWGLAMGEEIPRESDFDSDWNQASSIWLQDFDSTGGNRDSTLGGHTQSSVCIKTWGEEQWPHRRLNQTYLVVLEGLLQRWGVAVAHWGDKDTVSRSSVNYSLAWALHESTISLTKKPVTSSAGSLPAKQPTGRELSSAHQQTSILNFYWALPTRATASSTHHQSLPSGNLHKPLR